MLYISHKIITLNVDFSVNFNIVQWNEKTIYYLQTLKSSKFKLYTNA